MRTQFSEQQLSDPDFVSSEAQLRSCVHCGFCTATCPTYMLLGDELDSPRGRIYQIQEMLESGAAPTAETVKHVDRCLSCLACMTTCPSGVHYMHLVDHARAYIEAKWRRPLRDRLLRSTLQAVLTRPWLFRLSSRMARNLRFLAPLLPARLAAAVRLAPDQAVRRAPGDRHGTFAAHGTARKRMALLAGCVQPELAPQINAAAVRLLTRHGIEVVIARGPGCCGALPHHMGKVQRAHSLARAQIDAWTKEIEGEGLDAIVVTASGCGTTIKDYGFMFRDDTAYCAKASRVSALAKDITEVLSQLDLLEPVRKMQMTVAYQAPCSLQHGQSIRTEPRNVLEKAGMTVREPAEAHVCCGSAGTYNLLQPKIANQLRDRKVANLSATGAQIIASGNIGCIRHIASTADVPVVHAVELLDWATGGPKPAALEAL
jgi:glycolate oxidase iron-sulfur subunit